MVDDICTIGHNLGFEVSERSKSFEWDAGKIESFNYQADESQKAKTFMTARPYLNGNMHFKLDQDFMRKLNIEAARILGWVNSPKEASEQMGEPLEEINKHWKQSFRITL